MADRTVTDAGKRVWTCASAPGGSNASGGDQGQDVALTCTTPSVTEPVHLTVGWQWESMSPNGLARLISQASPIPRA
jgi:hypothetical protein